MSSPPVPLSVPERGDEGPEARASTARRSSLAVWPGVASTLSTSRLVRAAYRPVYLSIWLPWVGRGGPSRGYTGGGTTRQAVRFPPRMPLLAFLLATQLVPADTGPPYLAFPEPGLDDPAAYEGYQTRVYQDASGNTFQIYLKGSTGRVVHLWADAANESVAFTVRDSGGKPAEVAWGSSGASIAGSASRRWVSYELEAPSSVTIGLFLLGSMRVERDLQYARRDTLPLDSAPFPQAELSELIDHLAKLKPAERARHLSLLGAKTVDALRARLLPSVTASVGDTAWVVRVEQLSFDGKNHLWLALEGDTRETVPALSGSTVTIRRPAGGPVRLTVRVTTDAPALTPLPRAEIFNDEFLRFAAQVRADTAHPVTLRRVEREVRGVELLSYREKLMAGLPNFATYFGRDMLMTALLMQPVWAPAMSEHVVAIALGKLSPAGDVSHEEALGGQAIREHAAEYNRLVKAGRLSQARDVLAHLAATRENYIMVDDDFQLPVVAARYLADPRVPADRKRDFLRTDQHLARLVSNLAFVARQAAPYARDPVATNLVGFPRARDGTWSVASGRDSRVGYGGGRVAMDVNAIWVPHAREAARLRALPADERDYWNGVLHLVGPPADTLRFLALSLDGAGRPIPIVNTDPATLLLLESLDPPRAQALVDPIMRPYPIGLFADNLGPVVANDAYAAPAIWESFRRDAYHAPTVVWGREVNVLLAGLALQLRGSDGGAHHAAPLLDTALRRIGEAVDRSGLRHAELWSYNIENGRLVPSRYGTSSDVQLWSLTDLAVQYLLNHPIP